MVIRGMVDYCYTNIRNNCVTARAQRSDFPQSYLEALRPSILLVILPIAAIITHDHIHHARK